MDNKYTAIDLFCGAGGLSYGFESAGFDILLGIDNDAKALETFEANHNGAKSICGDITAVSYEKDIKPIIGEKTIDVVIGGPPCQGFSLSGPRNFDDPRNKLYLSYIRLVDEIKPRAFVIENVPGLVALFNGEVKKSIFERLESMFTRRSELQGRFRDRSFQERCGRYGTGREAAACSGRKVYCRA